MNRHNHQSDHLRQTREVRNRLLDEIAFFESRLTEIGHLGDCAYEKALARTYHTLIAARRTQLANLDG